MFSVGNYSLAIILCFLAMICWGSWQNTRNLAGLKWRFELYYWDFVSGILLFSLLMAFTFGSFGNDGRSFITDVGQASLSNIGYAMLGGAIWNIGTLLLTAGIAIAGMSVAFPIGGGIGWILGIVVLYTANPAGNPYFLFGGCAIVVLAVLLSMLSYRRLASQQKKTTLGGIVISLLAGVAIAFFYRFVDRSLAREYTEATRGFLTPYTAVVFFSLGAFASTFLYNPLFMRKPLEGNPVSMSDYLSGTTKQHLMGLLGGAIWCLGMSVSFMANKAASPAIAYGLSNAAPVVAALWGILVWKEFKGAPPSTSRLLIAMFAAYLIGLVAIVYARIA